MTGPATATQAGQAAPANASVPTPAAPALSARQEWAHGWPTMVAAMSGMIMSAVTTLMLGLFMAPLHAEFGWSRAEVSSGLMVVSVISFFAFPIVGKAVDRFGVRAVALPGSLLFGLLLGLIGQVANGSLLVWWLSWAVFCIGFAMVNPTVWAKAVSARFEAGKGMALGVMMCGSAAASLTIPQLTRWSIEHLGWRNAFAVAGMAPALLAFVLVFVAIRRKAPVGGGGALAPVDALDPDLVPGLTFAAAIRSPAVIKLMLAVLLTMMIAVGCLVHAVPLLGEHGLSPAAAAGTIGAYGIVSVITKLTCGWVSDRGGNRWLGALTFATPAVACAILLVVDGSFMAAAVAMGFLGVAAGAVLQLSAYLTTRYAGLRSFGQLYGLCSGLMAISGGVGPLVAGRIFDMTGNYDGLLLAGIPLGIVTGILMATLGPYPDFAVVGKGEGRQGA